MSRHLPLLTAAFPGQLMLDIDQIATLTKYSKGHIYNLVSAKKLPFKLATALGDKILVSVIEMADYLDSKLLSNAAEDVQHAVKKDPQKRKPGRPRGTTASRLQMQCFQAELLTSIYRMEVAEILGEIHSTVENLELVDEGVELSSREQLQRTKAQCLNRIAAAQARVAAIEVDLLVPLSIQD